MSGLLLYHCLLIVGSVTHLAMLGSLFVGFSQFPPQLRAKSSSPTPSSQCYRIPGKAHCQEKAKAHPGSGLWPIGIGVGQRLQVRLLKGSALARNPAHMCGTRVNISLKSIYFNRKGPSQDTGAQHLRNTRNMYPRQQTGYSSVGRASDCRVLQQSDGPWFNSGWPDFVLNRFPLEVVHALQSDAQCQSLACESHPPIVG